MTIQIDTNKCPQNHPCPALKICPVQALSQENFDAPKVNKDKCLDCGKCAIFCPMGALQLR